MAAPPTPIPRAEIKQLFAKELMVLNNPRLRTTQVACLSGVLWITEENSGDILLKQGQTHCCRASGKLLVQALTDSAVQLDS